MPTTASSQTNEPPTLDPPKSVLTEEDAQATIQPYIEGMLQWYWHETDKWEHWAWRLQIGVLVMSSLVTIVAALPTPSDLFYQTWMKWLVVLISALTTLLSGLLSKSGIERTAQLREQGRIKLVTLKQKALLRLTRKRMTDDERFSYLERLIDVTEDVEQHFGVNPLVAGRRRTNHMGDA
jgi:hypothetical protein